LLAAGTIFSLFSRSRLDQQQNIIDQLEMERQENVSLKSRLSLLDTELTNATNAAQQTLNENQNLRNQLSNTHNDVRRLNMEVNKERISIETALAQQKSIWMEEKMSLSHRIQELEGANDKLNSRFNKAEISHRKVNRGNAIKLSLLFEI
jgi:chromosome segregation ATPase